MNLKDKLLASFQQLPIGEISHLNDMKQEAITVFEREGFPTVRDEEWKYTNLRKLLDREYIWNAERSIVEDQLIENTWLASDKTYTLVCIDGKWDTARSNCPESLDINTIEAALKEATHKDLIIENLGKIAPSNETLTALNTSFIQEGLFIYVPAGVSLDKPIQVIQLQTDRWVNQPRTLIIVEKEANIKFIELSKSLHEHEPSLSNGVMEVLVGKNAQFELYKIQDDHGQASLIDHCHIVQKQDSTATVFTFSLNGDIVRNNLNFIHRGENITSNLYGITSIDGTTLVDHHTCIEHASPHCVSNELYKAIYKGQTKGVFNGKVLVDSQAQKTNAYQQNDNILLSEQASVDTKPQLEIFADDVRCSHGCTVGQLDTTGLFYLRQRGIPKKEAEALLLYAFMTDVFEKITVDCVQQYVRKVVVDQLSVSLSF